MGLLRRLLLPSLLTLLCSLSQLAYGATASLILSEESPAFREAAEATSAELRGAGHSVQTFVMPLRSEDNAALSNSAILISFGTRAAQTTAGMAPRALQLYSLLPRSAFEKLPHRSDDGRKTSAVFIDQPPARQMELLRLALPEWNRIGIIVSRDSSELGARLQASAKERRLRPIVELAPEESDIYKALQRLFVEPTVLVAVPDTALFNNRTISNILLTAYHHRSPVIGFSAAYVKAGALLALFSTPEQIGQQTGEAARIGLANGNLPPPAAPKQFRIVTNTYVAQSLGIALDDANQLRERLERSEGQ